MQPMAQGVKPVKKVISYSCSIFVMTIVDLAKLVLRINILKNKKEGWINQTKYIERVLQKYSTEDARSITTPLDPRCRFRRNTEEFGNNWRHASPLPECCTFTNDCNGL